MAAARSGGATLGALAFAALVLYASLYPFEGWRWPPGRDFVDMLVLPWPRWRPPFDLWSNLIGYLPLGALVCLALPGRRLAPALGLLLPAALSYGAEVAQHFLPGRHPSLLDFVLNATGAALGAALAQLLRAFGWIERLRGGLARWFDRQSAPALMLLALWPIALLFPSPIALGLGQVWPRLRGALLDLLEGVPWAAPWHHVLRAAPEAALARPVPAAEAAVTMLGLLAPCLVAFAIAPPGWRRVALTLGALALAIGVMTLSTALNFAPEHALSWWTPVTAPALAAATVLAVSLAWLPRRVVPGLGLMALTALVTLVAQAPADPYFAQSLRAWEQGRFIHLHGVSQWVGWLWPYAAMAWLLSRLANRG